MSKERKTLPDQVMFTTGSIGVTGQMKPWKNPSTPETFYSSIMIVIIVLVQKMLWPANINKK